MGTGHKTEEIHIEEHQMELENRIRNLLWTVSGDYTQEMKPDVSLFLRSKSIALYDGIKQGALAKFYDKDFLGLYLVKKIFLGASEGALTTLAQLCIEEAIGDKICAERPGIREIQRQAFIDILEQEYEEMPGPGDTLGYLRALVLRERIWRGESQEEAPGRGQASDGNQEAPGKISGGEQAEPNQSQASGGEQDRAVPEQPAKGGRIRRCCAMVAEARDAADTMSLIRIIDRLYNTAVDPGFDRSKGTLEQVLAVTLEDLTEFGWQDFLTEEMYEDALESYVEQLTANASGMEDSGLTKEMEEQRRAKKKIIRIPPEALEKAHTYVELNFGRTYLSETAEKRMNYLMCRDVHSDCSLYFTEGILKNPVKHNYQYEYAKRLKNKNLWLYHDKHRIVKRNISLLSEMLKKSLVLRSETQEVLSDRGSIVPSRLWRVGRSSEATVFRRELKGDSADFVVDVLVDASGSQMARQGEVAIQAYIISEALSIVGIPHRVMSYCTFWDYTVLQRFREYDDPRSANENIWDYTTSSNNRDGLAIKAVGYDLLMREEEKKVLIILSDGRPYDVAINRPNARNPIPYHGKYAIADTAGQVRRLRNEGVSVLGVFAGQERDLAAEKKIFGKDFAYIRTLDNFSKIVGRYLTKQMELES